MTTGVSTRRPGLAGLLAWQALEAHVEQMRDLHVRSLAAAVVGQQAHDDAFTARNSPLPTGTRQVANSESAVTKATKGAICTA